MEVQNKILKECINLLKAVDDYEPRGSDATAAKENYDHLIQGISNMVAGAVGLWLSAFPEFNRSLGEPLQDLMSALKDN